MKRAPVALFVYNRPWHTRQTVAALLANSGAAETELYVFSDAPANASSRQAVDEVRSYVSQISGFKSLSLFAREKNYGLADSIIDGVSEVCERHGRVIVVEDDLVTSPHFLTYMNQGLEKYQDREKVVSIHGYAYPVEQELPETFFLRGADCWGWATWQRGWDLFESDGRKLLAALKSRVLTRDFDFDDSYPYTRMLQQQIEGRNNSWAIRWYASAFLKDRLTLYPGRSLVHNIGLDASGEHCAVIDDFSGELAATAVVLRDITVEESPAARKAFAEFHRRTRASLITRIGSRLVTKMRRWIGDK